MLWKCCTQYASKFGKLSSGHRTGKGQFSFQSQRRSMPKNIQTTAQLHSSHMLARRCSKSFKLGFNSMWPKNLQMYKLVLEKAEEREIKLTTFIGSWRNQRNFRKTATSASLTKLKPLCGSQQTVEILKEMGISDHFSCLLRNLYAGQEATVRTISGTTDWFQIGKGVPQGCIFSPCLTYMQNTSCEIWARGITSWNQDCWEKKSTISDM